MSGPKKSRIALKDTQASDPKPERDFFDRFGDDLAGLILKSFYPKTKFDLVCVSKQWKRMIATETDFLAIKSTNLHAMDTRQERTCVPLEGVCERVKHYELKTPFIKALKTRFPNVRKLEFNFNWDTKKRPIQELFPLSDEIVIREHDRYYWPEDPSANYYDIIETYNLASIKYYSFKTYQCFGNIQSMTEFTTNYSHKIKRLMIAPCPKIDKQEVITQLLSYPILEALWLNSVRFTAKHIIPLINSKTIQLLIVGKVSQMEVRNVLKSEAKFGVFKICEKDSVIMINKKVGKTYDKVFRENPSFETITGYMLSSYRLVYVPNNNYLHLNTFMYTNDIFDLPIFDKIKVLALYGCYHFTGEQYDHLLKRLMVLKDLDYVYVNQGCKLAETVKSLLAKRNPPIIMNL